MNLKEAFHYQNFLDNMMNCVGGNITSHKSLFITKKKHLRSLANPEATDIEEIVDNELTYCNDDVIKLGLALIEEKRKLSLAIAMAKNYASINIDVAIEENKFRKHFGDSIKLMLTMSKNTSPKKYKETDYKFNAEGNQVPYVYEVEVEQQEAFNRAGAKQTLRDLQKASDELSSAIESIMVNTVVLYEPRFDVNDSFEDVMDNLILEADKPEE